MSPLHCLRNVPFALPMKRRFVSISSIISYIALAVLIAAGGCSKKKSMSVGGSYSIEANTATNYLNEPGGGGPRQLVYRNGGKTVVISTSPGPYYFLDENNSFAWHVYGEVLVYTDYQPKGNGRYRLMAFSP